MTQRTQPWREAPLPAGPEEGGRSRPSWLRREPRLGLVGWFILVVLGMYLIRLWQLQFMEGGYYQAQAERQQYRLVSVSPSRGILFDRNGERLVRNIPAYDVTVTPGYLPDDAERERAILERLAALIGVPYSSEQQPDAPLYRPESWMVGRAQFPPVGTPPSPGLLEMIDEVRYLRPYAPLVVAKNVDRETALLVAQEGGITMPGVGVEIVSRRSYISGTLISQVVGFLGPIAPEQAEEFEARGYDPNVDQIGYAGVEYTAEEALRGTPGRRYVEEDVLGQELSTLSETPATPGDNVYLTLDLQLQRVATEALQQALDKTGNRRGAVVALDPRDGQVLVMASLPTYDNNLFARQIKLDEYQALLDDIHQPLLNHAIGDQIPSGSIFKPILATAALQEGVINRYTTVTCPGRILLRNKLFPDDDSLAQPFYCWNRGGHGTVNVVMALAQSCDVFFYEVGGGFEDTDFQGLGLEKLTEYARLFGLGETTGIDIPGEAAGLVPSARWKRLNYQETWTTGDTYNLSIGQGYLLVTPLQMANVMATVANGGTLYQPQLIHHITDAEGNVVQPFQPKVIRQLQVDQTVWQIVHEGVEGAVEYGSATRAQIEGVRVAGKTGTAEYCDNLAIEAGLCPVPAGKTLPTHAWFMAYAPAEAPEIAVVAYIYNGGEGSTIAVPVVHDVLDYYFKRKAGLLNPTEPVTPTATAEP